MADASTTDTTGAASVPANVDWNAYLTANPDVNAYVQANLGEFGGNAALGAQEHYQMYGQAEGRALPTISPVTTPATGGLPVTSSTGGDLPLQTTVNAPALPATNAATTGTGLDALNNTTAATTPAATTPAATTPAATDTTAAQTDLQKLGFSNLTSDQAANIVSQYAANGGAGSMANIGAPIVPIYGHSAASLATNPLGFGDPVVVTGYQTPGQDVQYDANGKITSAITGGYVYTFDDSGAVTSKTKVEDNTFGNFLENASSVIVPAMTAIVAPYLLPEITAVLPAGTSAATINAVNNLAASTLANTVTGTVSPSSLIAGGLNVASAATGATSTVADALSNAGLDPSTAAKVAAAAVKTGTSVIASGGQALSGMGLASTALSTLASLNSNGTNSTTGTKTSDATGNLPSSSTDTSATTDNSSVTSPETPGSYFDHSAETKAALEAAGISTDPNAAAPASTAPPTLASTTQLPNGNWQYNYSNGTYAVTDPDGKPLYDSISNPNGAAPANDTTTVAGNLPTNQTTDQTSPLDTVAVTGNKEDPYSLTAPPSETSKTPGLQTVNVTDNKETPSNLQNVEVTDNKEASPIDTVNVTDNKEKPSDLQNVVVTDNKETPSDLQNVEVTDKKEESPIDTVNVTDKKDETSPIDNVVVTDTRPTYDTINPVEPIQPDVPGEQPITPVDLPVDVPEDIPNVVVTDKKDEIPNVEVVDKKETPAPSPAPSPSPSPSPSPAPSPSPKINIPTTTPTSTSQMQQPAMPQFSNIESVLKSFMPNTHFVKAGELRQLYNSLDPELKKFITDQAATETPKPLQDESATPPSDFYKDVPLEGPAAKDGGVIHLSTGGPLDQINAMTDKINSDQPSLQQTLQTASKDLQPTPMRPAAPTMLESSAKFVQPIKRNQIQQLYQSINPDLRSRLLGHAEGGAIVGPGGMAEGGLPARFHPDAPKGHFPEFITGHTGYYAAGRGTGQSDDIPAMLHDGDYVIDADAVAQLGDGSSKAGAQALEHFRKQIPHHAQGGSANPVPAKIADGEYVLPAAFVTALGGGDNKTGSKLLDKMREELREHKRSAPVNKIPPKAKSPLDYLRMANHG